MGRAQALVDRQCPSCAVESEVPYRLVGAPVPCPACGHVSVATEIMGRPTPNTGCELTYRSFNGLITGAAYRPEMAALLYAWFRYTIIGEGAATIVQSSGGVEVDRVELHEAIQDDSSRQFSFYNEAMTFWR